MTLGQVKDFIRNVQKNDKFDFSVTAIGPILALADSWQENWTTIFKRILARINKGEGYNDARNKNGKYMTLPINNKESMVIFFGPPQASRYLIYGFKIIKKA